MESLPLVFIATGWRWATGSKADVHALACAWAEAHAYILATSFEKREKIVSIYVRPKSGLEGLKALCTELGAIDGIWCGPKFIIVWPMLRGHKTAGRLIGPGGATIKRLTTALGLSRQPDCQHARPLRGEVLAVAGANLVLVRQAADGRGWYWGGRVWDVGGAQVTPTGITKGDLEGQLSDKVANCLQDLQGIPGYTLAMKELMGS